MQSFSHSERSMQRINWQSKGNNAVISIKFPINTPYIIEIIDNVMNISCQPEAAVERQPFEQESAEAAVEQQLFEQESTSMDNDDGFGRSPFVTEGRGSDAALERDFVDYDTELDEIYQTDDINNICNEAFIIFNNGYEFRQQLHRNQKINRVEKRSFVSQPGKIYDDDGTKQIDITYIWHNSIMPNLGGIAYKKLKLNHRPEHNKFNVSVTNKIKRDLGRIMLDIMSNAQFASYMRAYWESKESKMDEPSPRRLRSARSAPTAGGGRA